MLFGKRPKISFVVICYNREAYIRECLDSILSQDIDKEIICIDDCSTDNTYEIIQEYKKKHKGVRAYQNDENLGTCLTRYNGLSYCKGEYALLVDADDKLLPNSMSKIYNDAVKTNADVLEFGMETDSENSYQKYRSSTNEILTGNLLLYYSGEEKAKISNTLCNKLIKRDIYKIVLSKTNPDLRQSNYSDVVYFLWHILSAAKTFSFSETNGYYYYSTRGMTTHISDIDRLRNICGFSVTMQELQSVYGKSQALKRKWNIVCNQAVCVYLDMDEKTKEQTRYLLDNLMSTEGCEYLISEITSRKDSKIGTESEKRLGEEYEKTEKRNKEKLVLGA